MIHTDGNIENDKKILIIGSGPCGLGAAWRLKEVGYQNFVILDKSSTPGGLACTDKDEKGFLWDMGGHVIFSHYQYFDKLLDYLSADWCKHDRVASIWMRGRFIPYPLQTNIHRLPQEDLQLCLDGLIEAERKKNASGPPHHFGQWLEQSFGPGLLKIFFKPYNQKVWGVDPSNMNVDWMGERVATVDLASTIKTVISGKDQSNWGPNSSFRFPLHGGTGSVWSSLCKSIGADKFKFNCNVISINAEKKTLQLEDGSEEVYDHLISTMPLDRLCTMMKGAGTGHLPAQAVHFCHSSTHIIGLGFVGKPPPHLREKCWMYFPEDTCPFYRATVFSKYSPYNVPRPGEQWSLMLEVTETTATPTQSEVLIDEVIAGAINVQLLSQEDSACIISSYHKRLEYGYPVPFLGRDELCGPIFKTLEANDIYSRGRFGSWKYEISNQDHAMMQGVEVVDRLLFGVEEMTFSHPSAVNSRNHKEVVRLPKVSCTSPTYHDCEQLLWQILTKKNKEKSCYDCVSQSSHKESTNQEETRSPNTDSALFLDDSNLNPEGRNHFYTFLVSLEHALMDLEGAVSEMSSNKAFENQKYDGEIPSYIMPYPDRNQIDDTRECEYFYDFIQPPAEAVQAINEMIIEGHNVFIVLNTYHSIAEKITWISTTLGPDWVKRLVVAHDLTLLKGDFLICNNKASMKGLTVPSWKLATFSSAPESSNCLCIVSISNWTDWRLLFCKKDPCCGYA